MSLLTKALKGISKQMRRYNDAKKQDKSVLPHERHGTTSDKIGVIVNAILAILTFLAIVISYQANQTSQKALEYAKNKDSLDNIEQAKKDAISAQERIANRKFVDSTLTNSKQSVDAAKRYADISEKSLLQNTKTGEFYRKSIMDQNRAYVVIDAIRIEGYVRDSMFSIAIPIQNAGNTPAYKIHVRSSVTFAKDENDVDATWVSKKDIGGTEIYLPSNQTYILPKIATEIFKGDNGWLFENKKIDLFILVKAEYLDIFNQPHETWSFSRIRKDAPYVIYCQKFNYAN